jgi:soluble lytic murein transglycosylase-like protein
MRSAWLFMLGMGGLLLMQKKTPAPAAPKLADKGPMIALVRAEAQRQGVEPALALATAEVESQFDPNAKGDVLWAQKKPALYIKLVRDNPLMARNPARTEPTAWHSYGLFQLLAPHHVRALEHPSVLFDPQLNAQRGIAFIKGLMRKHGSDPVTMRLAYAGALNVSEAEKERVLKRFAQAYQRWHDSEAQGIA